MCEKSNCEDGGILSSIDTLEKTIMTTTSNNKNKNKSDRL